MLIGNKIKHRTIVVQKHKKNALTFEYRPCYDQIRRLTRLIKCMNRNKPEALIGANKKTITNPVVRRRILISRRERRLRRIGNIILKTKFSTRLSRRRQEYEEERT
jgi:hypothetical protein